MKLWEIAYAFLHIKNFVHWPHRHKWEDNIIMNLRETGWEGHDWIPLAQDRVLHGKKGMCNGNCLFQNLPQMMMMMMIVNTLQ
jgi:hypothetical protein